MLLRPPPVQHPLTDTLWEASLRPSTEASGPAGTSQMHVGKRASQYSYLYLERLKQLILKPNSLVLYHGEKNPISGHPTSQK